MEKPKTIVNVAMSLDGKIAINKKPYSFSDDKDWERVHKLRHKVDAILVGINTVIIDDPFLTVRLIKKQQKKQPLRIVIDTHLRIPFDAKILKEQNFSKTIVFTSKTSDLEKIDALLSKGISVVQIEQEQSGYLNLASLLHVLYRDFKVTTLLVEGGATVISQFINQNLIDEMYIYYAPILMGNKDTLNIYQTELNFDGKVIPALPKFSVVSVSTFGEGFLVHLKPDLEYKPKKKNKK